MGVVSFSNIFWPGVDEMRVVHRTGDNFQLFGNTLQLNKNLNLNWIVNL